MSPDQRLGAIAEVAEKARARLDVAHGAIMQGYRFGGRMQEAFGLSHLPVPLSKTTEGVGAINDVLEALLDIIALTKGSQTR